MLHDTKNIVYCKVNLFAYPISLKHQQSQRKRLNMWFQCSLRKQNIMMGTGFLSDLMPLLMSHQNQMKKLFSLP